MGALGLVCSDPLSLISKDSYRAALESEVRFHLGPVNDLGADPAGAGRVQRRVRRGHPSLATSIHPTYAHASSPQSPPHFGHCLIYAQRARVHNVVTKVAWLDELSMHVTHNLWASRIMPRVGTSQRDFKRSHENYV